MLNVRQFCLLFLLGTVAWASPDEERLLEMLLKDYHITTRPVLNTHDTLVLNFTYNLIGLKDVDIDTNTMIVEGWQQLQWTDQQLKWKPADHNNITALHVPAESLWKPDLKAYNGYDSTLDSTMMIVYSTGSVLWVPPFSTSVHCVMNPLWYPFDEQTCVLKFGSWTHDVKKMDLQAQTKGYENFYENKDWNLVSVKFVRVEKTYACCVDAYPSIETHITVRRKPCKIILGQALPVIMLTALALMTMIIPATRADIRLLVTSLLLGYIMIDTNYSDVPEAVSALTLLYGHLLFVFVGLFLCNCIHLAILKGQIEPSLLTKLAGIVIRDDKSENLISNVESRYHKTLDSMFTLPLTLILAIGTVMFITIPFF